MFLLGKLGSIVTLRPRDMHFRLFNRVRLKDTGVVYMVLGSPADLVIEATQEPAYSYRRADGSGPTHVLSQVEMEDGRFEFVCA